MKCHNTMEGNRRHKYHLKDERTNKTFMTSKFTLTLIIPCQGGLYSVPKRLTLFRA